MPTSRRRARIVSRTATAALLAGCASIAAPRYRGPKSDHFDGKRFHNYVRFKDRQIEDALRREINTLTNRREIGRAHV